MFKKSSLKVEFLIYLMQLWQNIHLWLMKSRKFNGMDFGKMPEALKNTISC